MSEPLLRISDLKTHFQTKGAGLFGEKKVIKAVDGVSFDIAPGEVLSLVGESGCGKSTVGRTLTHLEKATSGTAQFEGQDFLAMAPAEFRPLRREIQMIFQDPISSLNPRRRVADVIAEPLRVWGPHDENEQAEIVDRMLHAVGLDPEVARDKRPHEFSGGQCQRISIARALATGPKFVVADECVAALDVSIQADILNLLKQLQHKLDLTFLFISHDLSVVAHVCDYVAVMYLGEIVEEGPTKQIFANPKHSYTQALLGAIPSLDPDQRSRVIRSDRNTSK